MREVFVQDGDEAVVVVSLDQVGQLMGEHVLQTLHGLLGEFEVQPDAAGGGVAASPFRFHFLDAPFRGTDTKGLLPFLQQRRD